jgi:DNA-binding transcriptional MocR family regulator
VGGLSLWLALPRGIDDESVVEAAANLGVRFQSGRHFFIGEASRPFLRLTFSAIDESSMEEAMQRTSIALADTIHATM